MSLIAVICGACSEMGESTSKNDHFGAAYSLTNDDQTKEHYRNWAASYDREIDKDNGYVQPARTAQALVKHGFDVSGSVLDAGCGSGLSGVALQKIGCKKIVGCDFSPEMLALAKQKNVYSHLFEADLNTPLSKIDSSSFDAVTAVGVFSFGHVAPDACDELLRTLKPKGLFVIALNQPFWDKGDLREKLDTLEASGKIKTLEREYGDHLPGQDVMGWVLTMRKL